MRLVLVSMIMFIGACVSHPIHAAELRVDIADAMVIDQVISRGNILPLGQEMVRRSRLPGEHKVDLVISSPGGDVVTGFLFINMMDDARDNGLKIRCFVSNMAASMAFGILVHCDERYVLDHSFLLWHRARVSAGNTPLTAPAALLLAEDLQRVDDLILKETAAVMDMSYSTVVKHFEAETLHVGINLAAIAPGFCTSYPSISGLMDAMFSNTVPRTPAPMPSFLGRLVYIWLPTTN